MSETTIKPPESIPCSEIFPTREEYRKNVVDAIAIGAVEVVDSLEDQTVYPRIELGEQDILRGPSSDIGEDGGFSGKKFKDIVFCHPEAMREREAFAIEEEIVDHVRAYQAWYLNEPRLRGLLSEGSVQESYRIESVDQPDEVVDIVNFSETRLTDTQRSALSAVINTMNQSTAGDTIEELQAICIVPTSFIGEDTLGQSIRSSRIIMLNEKILEDHAYVAEVDQTGLPGTINGSQIGVTNLEATLAHELWHLEEPSDTEPQAYKDSTGWSGERAANFVDDFGVVKSGVVSLDFSPVEVSVTQEDGSLKADNAIAVYGLSAVLRARPVSRYGETNSAEDAAEAYAVFANTDRSDISKLDPLRRNAITGILQRISASADLVGPRRMTMSAIDPRDLVTVRHSAIGVAEPSYSLRRVATAEGYKDAPDDIPPPETAYTTHRRGLVVDDYGNQVQVKIREPAQD